MSDWTVRPLPHKYTVDDVIAPGTLAIDATVERSQLAHGWEVLAHLAQLMEESGRRRWRRDLTDGKVTTFRAPPYLQSISLHSLNRVVVRLTFDEPPTA